MDNGNCVDNGKWTLLTKDLNKNTFDSVDKDWKVVGAQKSNVVSDCGGTSLLGGSGVFSGVNYLHNF